MLPKWVYTADVAILCWEHVQSHAPNTVTAPSHITVSVLYFTPFSLLNHLKCSVCLISATKKTVDPEFVTSSALCLGGPEISGSKISYCLVHLFIK